MRAHFPNSGWLLSSLIPLAQSTSGSRPALAQCFTRFKSRDMHCWENTSDNESKPQEISNR